MSSSTPGSPTTRTLHLAVDLTDAGAHPAAWRTLGSQARQLFDADRLQDLVSTAQRGTVDLVLFDDAFSLQPGRRGGVQGRLDAALVAARLAPRSEGVGLVPTVTTTHTEPFHVSKALATIDHASHGRAGWQVAVSTGADDAAHVGRRQAPDVAAAWAEAAEAIDVVSRLWDSWEDDAEIRDVETGRFVDRDKLHYVDHDGVHFAVKGPSITPRPPQGHPVVVVRVDSDAALAVAAEHADVVRVRATTLEEARALREQVRSAAADHGRDPDDVIVLVDLYAVIGPDRASAQARLDLLEGLAGVSWDTDSYTHVGTDRDLAVTAEEWFLAGAADGFTVRPSSLQTDLVALVDGVVPLLRRAGIYRTEYTGTTLRDSLGLARPANRYAAAIA
ncbi:flavin-dependent oxidoreductase, F420-dependent methylene-tetrahydromethanopterin reductase [Sanguibacter keddieii DSM 10542]|uniref:Flavin-dependent oxidoreductase, F420-dependent methylene-tetrahydromethanopterin reductase n=1 Tax=Sanguibacter keddieii (strain ATCC 51767 / DSM 10542 / NCFB 3025 / ST-74) TaxID=446469 RepID=D1BES3_SANKS|nr:LLM class flavin-dependent oxidoreductase [Sanguibacter keddieii]ACZ23359.1 flavin-dependent oxidoreductase, F420-dependent methylene-tetrahydromethanopterin reductase [Sanguibacter keddieii DSM 10542]